MSTASLPAGQYLKIADLARLLDLSTRTIWRYVAIGRLPEPVRFSKVCVRWKAEEVQRVPSLPSGETREIEAAVTVSRPWGGW